MRAAEYNVCAAEHNVCTADCSDCVAINSSKRQGFGGTGKACRHLNKKPGALRMSQQSHEHLQTHITILSKFKIVQTCFANIHSQPLFLVSHVQDRIVGRNSRVTDRIVDRGPNCRPKCWGCGPICRRNVLGYRPSCGPKCGPGQIQCVLPTIREPTKRKGDQRTLQIALRNVHLEETRPEQHRLSTEVPVTLPVPGC